MSNYKTILDPAGVSSPKSLPYGSHLECSRTINTRRSCSVDTNNIHRKVQP